LKLSGAIFAFISIWFDAANICSGRQRSAKRLIQEFCNCCFYNEKEKQRRRRQDKAIARAMGEKEEHYGRENVNYLGFCCFFLRRATNFYNLMQTNFSFHGTCDSSMQKKFFVLYFH
jgi:hypothetical protein